MGLNIAPGNVPPAGVHALRCAARGGGILYAFGMRAYACKTALLTRVPRCLATSGGAIFTLAATTASRCGRCLWDE